MKNVTLICKKEFKGCEVFGRGDFTLNVGEMCYTIYDDELKNHLGFREKNYKHINHFFISGIKASEHFYTEREYRKLKLEKINNTQPI